MAMMMSQIQLLSNRLQKQLFIVVSPYQNLRGGFADRAARPSVIILCGNTEKVKEKCRTSYGTFSIISASIANR